MANRYIKALLSSTLSIGPIILIVIVLGLTGLAPLDGNSYLLLGVGAVVLILGLALFQIGASSSLSKVGEYMGGSLSKQKSLFIIIVFALALGALITCAEPSILIVSKQVDIDSTLMISFIAAGVGIFVVIGILRIIFNKSLKIWYLIFYMLTFMLITLIGIDENKKAFLPFIFDSGGVTTGSATVPFILALGAGVATVRGGKESTSDSFGLVGMASIGPILTMTLLILLSPIQIGVAPSYAALDDSNVFARIFVSMIPHDGQLGSMIEVLIALSPVLVIFTIYELIFIRLPKNRILKLLIGFAFTFVGLTLFLGATGATMTPIGYQVGISLGEQSSWLIILFAFIIGLVTILCEPAVHVLTSQMEQISDGRIKKVTVLVTLSIGVGVAIALAAVRVIFHFSILYYMVPGYIIALCLMFICPNIYTAMAFDSGGTASGPMSTSFVLPMVVGVAVALGGDTFYIYENAFGVVALIALTPVIAIQVLGVVQSIKKAYSNYIMRKHVFSEDDAEIIHFHK